jgi:TatD DNase family protein
MIFCDSHIHAALCKNFPCVNSASCAHEKTEFFLQEKIAGENSAKRKIFCGFGLHPQNPDENSAFFLEELLRQKRISFIGETGFDFFTAELKSAEIRQKKCFETCLELAEKFGVPLVIHNRKALEKIFFYSTELKKLRSVIFHAFAFSSVEAFAILKKMDNAFFSVGSQILRGNKKSVSCAQKIPAEKILLETDAPFQTLKGEKFSSPERIFEIYEKFFFLRGEFGEENREKIGGKICENFLQAFS